MDKKFCFDALAEEGFQPEIDEDGDISFLAGEISLSLILDEEDKDFFSLVCAFEVDDMDQLELFYSAASEASREYRIAKANLTKAAAERALNAFLASVEESLAKDDKLTLTGFGTFVVETRKERQGRNPRTGETLTIPACKMVKFRPGKMLKDALD